MRGIGIGLAAVTVMAATPAMASDWWLIDYTGAKPGRAVIFINLEREAVPGSIQEVWTAEYFETPDKDFDYSRTIKVLERFDCQNQRSSATYMILLKGNSGSDTSKLNGDWSPISPDSIADEKYQLICGKKTIDQMVTKHIGANPDFAAEGRVFLASVK